VRADTPADLLARTRQAAIVLGATFAVSIPLFFVWGRQDDLDHPAGPEPPPAPGPMLPHLM
jgi:hypothetical protein